MKNSVKQKTIAYDLCINCGVCKFICPQNAIDMKQDWRGEFLPNIKENCTDCGKCAKFCSNTHEKMQSEALKISRSPEPQTFGLENANYYLAYNNNNEERVKSASGGVITKFARYLLKEGAIHGVIHGERLFAKIGEAHYRACISKNEDQIAARASSIYAQLDFSPVLDEIETDKKYLLIATPCIIRGLKPILGKNVITCALICSHNVSNVLSDYFANLHRLPDDVEYAINMRNKDDIPDANNFNSHLYTKSDDLLKMNRNKSGWTEIWRAYYFAMNCCNYCSDFWGYEADFSVKDAWGEWACDPLGKSIAVFRNKELEPLFKLSGIELETLDYDKIKDHQSATSIFKQKEAENKNFKSPLSRSNRRNKFLKNLIITKTSKFLYRKFGFGTAKVILKILCKIL